MSVLRTVLVSGGIIFGWSVIGACSRTELDGASDASEEIANDAAEEDATEDDALPTIDQFTDSPIPTDCPDAGSTLIYVISSENDLYSFYPPTLAFTKIGTIACTPNSTPYSMAVDHLGTAYSVFADGSVWQIDTKNASCKSTTYQPVTQDGDAFHNFGMGFVANQNGESLYIADAAFNANSQGLATLDTTTFKRSFVADFQPELPRCELTGTGDGRLFAFCLFTSGDGSQIAEINPKNAAVVAMNTLKLGNAQDAFAYAFWGGEFWIFTGPSKTTQVTRYDPITFAETPVTTIAATIVGAGVSTCAPQ